MPMKVLIAGAGIAGPTLAHWLSRYGAEPTIVEKAPALRAGGYIIDFWGAGYEVARRMGLLDEVRARGYTVREVRVVARDGATVVSFPSEAFTRATGGGFTSLPRGELAEILCGSIAGRVETLFGDTIVRLEPRERGVEVSFGRHPPRTFDAVVGADGLHSAVRSLAFGPESPFERYLGVKVAAFTADGYRPRDELTYLMFTEAGQQVSRFSMNGDRTVFLFTFADADPALPATMDEQKAVLRRRFGGSGWECPAILAALDNAGELYFDRVSQIELRGDNRAWSRGRVALVGDAAFSVSLLGGQGSALAMAAAYLLAGELERAGGDVAEAFARYESRFRPFVSKKQRAARRFAGALAPKSRASLFLRNQIFHLFSIPAVATLAASGGLSDRIELPEYQPSA